MSTYCPHGQQICRCGQALIHRDNRQGWESASALGQIISIRGPEWMTGGDIDFYAYVEVRSGLDVVRIIEHKQPGQRLKRPQESFLRKLGEVFDLSVDLEKIDPRSGVYLVRGDIGGLGSYPSFKGPHGIEKMDKGRFVPVPNASTPHVLDSEEDLFRWIEATANPGPRRGGRLRVAA